MHFKLFGTTEKVRPTSDPPIPPQPAFRASDHINDNKPHLLLAATGSVATIKLPNILTALSHYNISIRVVLSDSASQFLQSQSAEQPSLSSLLSIPNVDGIYRDESEWEIPWTRGAAILHIELRRWADLMAIVPLSANSLAKLVNGISDSLVLAVARAWDTTGLIDPPRDLAGPGNNGRIPAREKLEEAAHHTGARKKVMIVAPAMNTAMWLHPVTAKHIRVLEEEWGVDAGGWVQVLRPVDGELACGDVGGGAMRDWKEVVAIIEMRLGLSKTVDRAG